jgi:peptide subunit release factor RF-3
MYHSKIIEDFLKKDKQSLDIPVIIASLFKLIIFKKISKKDKRCVKCDARNLCGSIFKCQCNMEQQYQRRWFLNWL